MLYMAVFPTTSRPITCSPCHFCCCFVLVLLSWSFLFLFYFMFVLFLCSSYFRPWFHSVLMKEEHHRCHRHQRCHRRLSPPPPSSSPLLWSSSCFLVLMAFVQVWVAPVTIWMPWLARQCLPIMMWYNPGAGLHNSSLWIGGLFILQEVGLQHFVGVAGTGQKASSHDPQYTSYKCGKHVVFDFPVRPGSIYPHKCAGVIIAISTQTFTSRNVVRVVEVPAEFSGRVAAVRVRRSEWCGFFLSLYVPTERRTIQERQRVGKLWAYTGRLLDAVPARCVPILCLDANAMSLLLLAMLTVNVKTEMGSSCENFANVIICVWLIHFSMLVLPIKVNRPGLCRKREARVTASQYLPV